MATITAHDPAPVIGHAGHRATPATAQAAWSRMPVAWTAALGCAIAFIVVLQRKNVQSFAVRVPSANTADDCSESETTSRSRSNCGASKGS